MELQSRKLAQLAREMDNLERSRQYDRFFKEIVEGDLKMGEKLAACQGIREVMKEQDIYTNIEKEDSFSLRDYACDVKGPEMTLFVTMANNRMISDIRFEFRHSLINLSKTLTCRTRGIYLYQNHRNRRIVMVEFAPGACSNTLDVTFVEMVNLNNLPRFMHLLNGLLIKNGQQPTATFAN